MRWLGGHMKECCGDVVPGCSARFQLDSNEEILEAVAIHARGVHGMNEVPRAVVDQVLENMRVAA